MDPIERQAVGYVDGFADGYELGKKMHNLLSEEQKSKWIKNDNGTYSCSICQAWIPEEQRYYARYCLYCGKKMEGESWN